jgi:hypothetical protein
MTLYPLKSTPTLVDQVCARLARQLRDEREFGDGKLTLKRLRRSQPMTAARFSPRHWLDLAGYADIGESACGKSR